MTENVNGLQVDISKYVGEEIARLAVASIGEDTLKQLAEKAIKDLYEQRWFGTERATTIHTSTEAIAPMQLSKPSSMLGCCISTAIPTIGNTGF